MLSRAKNEYQLSVDVVSWPTTGGLMATTGRTGGLMAHVSQLGPKVGSHLVLFCIS